MNYCAMKDSSTAGVRNYDLTNMNIKQTANFNLLACCFITASSLCPFMEKAIMGDYFLS